MNGKTKKIIQWTAGVIFSLLIIFVILISSFFATVLTSLHYVLLSRVTHPFSILSKYSPSGQ